MTSTAHTTLVSTAALAAHLDDATWVVFDCRHDLARPDAGELDVDVLAGLYYLFMKQLRS